MIGVVAIGHDLLRLLSQRRCAPFQRGLQLAVIDRVGRRVHVHHQAVGHVGEQLHIVAGHRAALAVSHHMRVRIGAGGPRYEVFSIVLLLLLQTLHFTHRRFESTRPLPRRSSPCRRLPMGGCLLLLPFCVQDAHLLARQFQVRFQFLFAAEAIASGVGFDFGSVQCHPFQTDQTFGAQHAEYLHEQIIQPCLVF